MPDPDEFFIPKDLIAVRFRTQAFSCYLLESQRLTSILGLHAAPALGKNSGSIGANSGSSSGPFQGSGLASWQAMWRLAVPRPSGLALSMMTRSLTAGDGHRHLVSGFRFPGEMA